MDSTHRDLEPHAQHDPVRGHPSVKEDNQTDTKISGDWFKEPDFGNLCFHDRLDLHGQDDRGRRTALARTGEADLHNSIRVDADDLNITAIGPEIRTDVMVQHGFEPPSQVEEGVDRGTGIRVCHHQ